MEFRRKLLHSLNDIVLFNLFCAILIATCLGDEVKQQEIHSNATRNQSNISEGDIYQTKQALDDTNVRLEVTKWAIVDPNLSFGKSTRDTKRSEVVLSEDCYAKRIEILRRHHESSERKLHQLVPIPDFQKLKPKHENSTLRSFSESYYATNNVENEHIPQCTETGRYVPTQCHKIGYCWCVNRYGQAIKNSAADAKEPPVCDVADYESESVVTGVSANRLKNLLRAKSSSDSFLDANQSEADLEFGATNEENSALNNQDDDFARQVAASQEPSLALVPNECTLSKIKSKERALKHADDSIWIPECDSENHKLYAEKQCHKSKICWCVDQTTGLPLRTGEQLAAQANINCTEIKKIVDIAQTLVRHNTQKPQSSFYQGLSELCDANKRADFVRYLINQFRQQISDYLRHNPTSQPPEGITSSNPHGLADTQVAMWKFNSMDLDFDSKIDDREWSKFKINFKLIDKFEDIQRTQRHHLGARIFMTPLVILRSQRRCWRDFLEFCSSGDLLIRDSINLTKWLSCTELPSKTHPIASLSDKLRGMNLNQNSPILSAIARSRRRNPFLGILKPD